MDKTKKLGEMMKDLEATQVAGFETLACYLSVLTHQNQKGGPLTEEEYLRAWNKGSSELFTNYLTYTSKTHSDA